MDIKQLRYFEAVAKHLSFSRAAEHLHIAQPALSMSIKKLEQQLALTLFHRNDRKISLTDEGNELLRHARVILRNMADAEHAMQQLRGIQRGVVRVGIPSMLGSYHFPPILMAFKHRYPELDLEVIEGGTWQIQQQLERGELDLGVIVAELVPDSLCATVFLQQEVMVTVSREHPLASQQQVTAKQFFEQELVMFKEGYFHRKVVDRLANQTGATPKISFETNLVPLIKSIVKQGFGISTLLGMAVDDDQDLVALPFAEPVILDLSLAWSRDRHLSIANQTFLDFVLEHSCANK
ncbi:LysR family transcriptional regulator [Neptunomonas sp. XY-337]|uniref:LysR family transcriptional regulator n=1 Tax=Neptunomonas sp. XY-337 TaxID=2561897 RepID=UPI0010AB49B7|nr:LysR family transcriptional regulator [Neptunomonas sp. XY-337]